MTKGNEAAYPVLAFEKTGEESYVPGLTKREAFSMAAMQGMYANPKYLELLKNVAEPGRHSSMAETAVKAADALIAALNSTNKEE